MARQVISHFWSVTLVHSPEVLFLNYRSQMLQVGNPEGAPVLEVTGVDRAEEGKTWVSTPVPTSWATQE